MASWAVVVMNAAGNRGVTADVSVGAKSGAVLPIGLVLLGLGLVGLATSAGLIYLAVSESPGPPGGVAAPASGAPEAVSAEQPFRSTSRPSSTSR